MTRHMRIPIALTVLLTTVISCSDSARQEELAELRSQRRSLLMQFSSVQNVIRRVQAQDPTRADVAVELMEGPIVDTDPAVVQAFATLRDSVVAAMLRIDPGAQRSIDLMAELEAQVAEIDAEILRLSE